MSESAPREPNMAEIAQKHPDWTESQRNREFNKLSQEYHDGIAKQLRAEKASKR